MQNRKARIAWVATFMAVWLSADIAFSQSFRRGGVEFNAVRSLTVPKGKPYAIVVVEFYHHGEIHPDGRNVVVATRNRELVPTRILQLGPGDFCRLAFQTIKGRSGYDIFYGGEPPREDPPPWSCHDGLLLETRRFNRCNLNHLDSVRNAFNAAVPIGADYVEGVFHGGNPFNLKREPFFSRYSGYMDLTKGGVYGFITSSRDCSFLLVDDKLVTSAPGRHGPLRRARPGSRHDVRLSAGLHKFEYYHAAASPNAVMVAAWEIDPIGEKTQKPRIITSEIFHTHLVGRLPAGRASLRTAKQVPDFTVSIAGDVLLPENDVPLLGALFRDISSKVLTMQGAKIHWAFGDGQTSNLPKVDHVYLRPGLYAVTLSIRRGGKTVETTNRIYVDRPLPPLTNAPHSLDEYLKIIETYDPKALDAASLRQMVLALEAKSLALANRAEDIAEKERVAAEDPNRRPDARHRPTDDEGGAASKGVRFAADRYLAKAVAAGQVAFATDSAAKGDEELLKLARLIGSMARVRLGDSPTAFQIWQGAAERIAGSKSKAECEIVAADIAVNDLLKPSVAKPLLEAATKQLGKNRSGPIVAELWRVWGDYHAATGDGRAARKAYIDAEENVDSPRRFVEKMAWRGAYTRSTEEFIAEKQYVRAAEELLAWQREFPTEKLDGYLTLLWARYWAGRDKYPQAIAQAEQLQAVSPNSPHVDQLLLLAADSEMRLGRRDRALATLHSLVKDYPGSPLVPLAKKNIKILEKGTE